MRKALIALLIVILVLVGGVWLYLDRIVESMIEDTSQQAMGVETDVRATTLNLWTGNLGLTRFTAQNPPADTAATEYFMTLEAVTAEAPLSAMWRDTVAISQIMLDDLTLNLAQRGPQSNYQPILSSLNTYMATAEVEPGPAMIVQDLRIRNVNVHLTIAPGIADLSEIASVTATVPALRLQNMGAEEGSVTPAQLTALVVTSVLRAVLESEGSRLPAVVRGVLQTQLNRLPHVPVTVEGNIAWSGPEDLQERARQVLEDKGRDLLDRTLDRLGVDTSEGES